MRKPRRLRYQDDLLQLHAGAGLDPHRTRLADARWRPCAALRHRRIRRLRLLHAGAPGAEAEFSEATLAAAKAWAQRASEADKAKLLANIMAGLPRRL